MSIEFLFASYVYMYICRERETWQTQMVQKRAPNSERDDSPVEGILEIGVERIWGHGMSLKGFTCPNIEVLGPKYPFKTPQVPSTEDHKEPADVRN